MEIRSFQWTLDELTLRKASFQILDCIVCRGQTVHASYTNDYSGALRKKPAEESIPVKHLLNTLLEKSSPLMKEFKPSKLVCFVYSKKRAKAFTVRDIIQIPSSRIKSMKILSVHIPRSEEVYVYRVFSSYKEPEVECSFKKLYISNKYNEPDEEEMRDKLAEYTVGFYEYFNSVLSLLVQEIQYDVLVDENKEFFLMKFEKIQIKGKDNSKRLGHRSARKTRINLPMRQSSDRFFIEMLVKNFKKINNSFCSLKNIHSLSGLLDEISMNKTMNSTSNPFVKKPSLLKTPVQYTRPVLRKPRFYDQYKPSFNKRLKKYEEEAESRSKIIQVSKSTFK